MTEKPKFNKRRYRKLVWFFATIFLHVIWWDLILRRTPLIRGYAEKTSIARWQAIARRFRKLALEMGGVMIKLGQFLSVRVDILPAEVIGVLANLQDEVPAEPIDKVVGRVESEFGRPLHQVYQRFDPEPMAAASLAQTHRAMLMDGKEVVVKVQRPGIDTIVETDLAAIEVAIRWLKYYPRINKRVNLDWLAEEFSKTTRVELDFVEEGHSAEHFAADFVDESRLYAPTIYWDYSTGKVLTMENVAYIRIADLEAIDEANISRQEVAKALYDIYMQQVFVTHFVHADPHPGNLFVRPLSKPSGAKNTPFQIVFVDFGMMVVVPERLRAALRDYAIGVGTRDVSRIMTAYIEADVLLPGADLKRLEEAHEMVFDRFWGAGMTQLRQRALAEAPELIEEYRDLIYEMPFQFQADMLFVVRAIGLLSGMATNLDPDFDPWSETIPFAETLAKEELQKNWQEWLTTLLGFSQNLLGLPNNMDAFFKQAQRGRLSLETSLAPDARRTLRQIDTSVRRLTWAVVSTGVLMSGVMLRIAEQPNTVNSSIIAAAGVIFVWKVIR